MRGWLLAAALPLLAACGGADAVAVGSKDFVEQDVLAELISQELEERGVPVERRFHFGGSKLTHEALVNDELDLYVEYTGTALVAVLGRDPIHDADSVYTVVEEAYLDRWDLVLAPPLGFENTFAVIVRAGDADSLGLEAIGDLAAVDEEWTAGFGPEFMSREDGYPGLKEAYGIAFGEVKQMDLGLLYRALDQGEIDVAVGNSTDGQIAAFDLRVLNDNRNFFPPYEAVPVVRRETIERHPRVWDVLQRLEGVVTAEQMRELNRTVVVEDADIPRAVRRWRARHLRPGKTAPIAPEDTT
ncbi:MAG: glycine betaine ABC transporter substrate-binding protein [Gemmatimonadota bacterium]|nr:glycine betaine ABC transporter substrate-binding protein [Gemmatimonadota bacterium]